MEKRFLRRIRRQDRLARWLISTGGVGVIFCVLAMLLLIAGVALPLFRPARAERLASLPLPAAIEPDLVLAVGLDDFRESGFFLTAGGDALFLDLRSGRVLDRLPLPRRPGPDAPGRLSAVTVHPGQRYTLLWADGSATLLQVSFHPEYSADHRVITHRVAALAHFPPFQPQPLAAHITAPDDSPAVQVLLLRDNRLHVRRLAEEDEAEEDGENGGAIPVPRLAGAYDVTDTLGGRVGVFTVDHRGETLYAGTDTGTLYRWDMADALEPRLLDRVTATADRLPVTALHLLLGDDSVAVGDGRGALSTWSPVRLYGPESTPRLERIHRLASHAVPITQLLSTLHDKTLFSLGADGRLGLDHMTSERHLLRLDGPPALRLLGLSQQGDSLLALDAAGQLQLWRLHSPHPEISWRVLFGRVWYEGYDRPEFVWQSSAASDEFEAKFSFVPLLFGSLKGTCYALLFAVPLGLLGAIYTSQFTRPEVRNLVKPTVEMMAAVPSVVIGFLAALWLAPRVESAITGVFLFALTLPLSLVLFLVGWQAVRRRRLAKRVERGYEFLALVPVLAVGVVAALLLGPRVEGWLFAGDVRQWLYQDAGIRFDQRNCVVIAFALGFAVVPIIFTMAEDALSNVPRSLQAASLALGASRWQTVWRVMLPSASPGIFAAIIIGFGRAVGETMIVLMATGNTPILSASPFNGMRTLSANIAVEIPEAPAGGTLFRVLFLSAVLLFLLTSVLNTAAELLRHRLRKKYGY